MKTIIIALIMINPVWADKYQHDDTTINIYPTVERTEIVNKVIRQAASDSYCSGIAGVAALGNLHFDQGSRNLQGSLSLSGYDGCTGGAVGLLKTLGKHGSLVGAIGIAEGGEEVWSASVNWGF